MERYGRIASDFGYDIARDRESALALDRILDGVPATGQLRDAIAGRPVFCVGAGPSLESWIPTLLKHTDITCIAADSALLPLVKCGMVPHVVVTDLDGDAECLMEMKRRLIYVVHAHGDNMLQLPMAGMFDRCVGTTQTEPVGSIQNFGGFTDGDRAVFLAHHFGASAIVALGMDLGGPVSEWTTSDAVLKMRKLRVAAELLEWLATFSSSALYTASYSLQGFGAACRDDMGRILGSVHAR